MYCHRLTATKHNHELEVPCEDTPAGYIGIWPYDLDLPESTYDDLLVASRLRAPTIGSDYRLYTREMTLKLGNKVNIPGRPTMCGR